MRPFAREDKATLVQMANDALGEGYFIPSEKAGFTRIAERADKVIGFCFSQTLVSSSSQSFGLIKTLVVAPGFRNKGIGAALLDDAIQQLKTSHAEYIAYIAWKSQKGIRMEKLLHSLGFEERAVLKKNWYRSSLELGFDCPDCGNPCICDAVWFEMPG